MKSDKKNINVNGLSLESSIDPFIDLSDLKRRELLKYSNRDLYLLNLKNDLIFNGKTLFYPYCGLENLGLENYNVLKTLDYKNFILADSRFKEYSSKEFDGGKKKFIYVDLDPLMIIEILLSLDLNIHIDCIICENVEIHKEDYSFLLEMSIPLFTDSLIYVGSRMNRVGGKFRVIDKFNKKLPYKHKLNIDSDYFNFFTDKDLKNIFQIFGNNNDITLFENKSQKSKVFQIRGINIYLVHDSIFQYLSMMDLCFVEYDNDFQQSIINQNFNNVFDVRGHYIRDEDGAQFNFYDENDILYLCRSFNARKIAFTKNWKNAEQIRVLTIYPTNGLTDLYIFCDLEDYNELYLQRFDEDDD